MSFIIINQEIFQINLSIHNINTVNKHHLQRTNVNLPCFQKSTFYAGITIFISLPPSLTIGKYDKAKFPAALRKYLSRHFSHSGDDLIMCKDDLWYSFCKMFVVYYTVNLYVCVFTTSSTSCCLCDTRIHIMYVCVHVFMWAVFKPVWGIAVGELKYCTCECLFKLMTLEALPVS